MSSSTASSSSSAPSSSYTGDSSGLGTTSSGQLPYSFLLTFVAVFLFFIGCGFGTRRLSIELRRTMVHAAFQRMEQPPAPELHDVYPKHARGPSTGRYRDFLPLSVTYLREEKDEEDDELFSEPHVQVPELPRGIRILEFVPFVSIFLAMRTLRRMREVHAAAAAGSPIMPPPVPEPPPPPVRAVSVSVLIAMPSPHHPYPRHSRYSYSSGCSKDIADYAIPSLTYAPDAEPLAPIPEEHRRDSTSSGKARESGGYPGSGAKEGEEAEDDSSRVYTIGIAEVPWDSGEVDLS